MSLYSYSTNSSLSNSYCLLSSSSSSSITTVSSQLNNERKFLTTDDDDEQSPINKCFVQDHWQIEKNISLKDQQTNGCILKTTMTKEQIIIHDPSLTQPIIIPGKHISMKIVFN